MLFVSFIRSTSKRLKRGIIVLRSGLHYQILLYRTAVMKPPCILLYILKRRKQTRRKTSLSPGRPLVRRAMAGQVGVVFAYGQTGSGKTHTMVRRGARDSLRVGGCGRVSSCLGWMCSCLGVREGKRRRVGGREEAIRHCLRSYILYMELNEVT